MAACGLHTTVAELAELIAIRVGTVYVAFIMIMILITCNQLQLIMNSTMAV